MNPNTRIRLLAPALALAALFSLSSASAADYDAAVSSRLITKTGRTSNGAPIRYPDFAQPEISALEVTIAGGAETGWHRHSVPVYAYVLSGTLRVDIDGGQSQTFKPGDAIIEVVNTWHNGRNIGCEPVRLAVFYLGGKEVSNVEKSAKPLAHPMPPPVLNCPRQAAAQ